MSAGATHHSLGVWGQIREALVPVLAYWALLLFTFATYGAVVAADKGLSADTLGILIAIALGTLPGVALGQVMALLRVRTWLLVLFGAGCWTVGMWAGVAGSAVAGGFGAVVAVFFLFLPIALTAGLWSLETHRAVWATWLPVTFTSGSVILWAEGHGKDAAWFAGDKWAIWDLVTLAFLGFTVVLALVYLVTRETHRLALWRRGPQAPLQPSVVEKGAARPRLSLGGGCLLLLLGAGMTIAVAVISPYLWRTGPGDREGHHGGDPQPEQVEGPAQPEPQPEEEGSGCDREASSGKPTPAPDPADSPGEQEEMGEKVVEALKKAGGVICPVLTLAILALAGALIGGPPLRRLVLVRHLRDPIWPVSPTSRIEQGWRLVEIALGDAGVVVHPGEDARGLARRARPVLAKLSPVEVHGLDDAAEVADRVRYGLGVGARDVATMERFSAWAYDTVWERLGDGEQVRCMYRPL